MNGTIVARLCIVLAVPAAGGDAQAERALIHRSDHIVAASNTEIVSLEGEITAYENFVVSIAQKGQKEVIRVRLDNESSLVREAKLEGQHGEVRWARVAATPSALKRGARVSIIAMREGRRPWRAVSVVVRLDPASLPLPGRPLHEQPQTPRRAQSTT